MAETFEPDYASPDSFYVFVVGNCKEWPENRELQGDIAVHREYINAGVPLEQTAFVKDDDTTTENCREQFITLLTKTRLSTTLVFYYGRHGIASGFKTQGSIWRYNEVISLIESHFRGDRVLLLLDCCASGNCCEWVASPHSVSKDYAFLCSAPPHVEATDEGEEWVLNNCWIQCMRRNNGTISLSQAMDIIVDRTALVFGDQFFCFVTPGVNCNESNWMPRRTSIPEDTPSEWQSLIENIPDEGKVSPDWETGDYVFYKHKGGLSSSLRPCYVPPCWLLGRILESNDDGRLKLTVKYPIHEVAWEVEESRDRLMNDFAMAQMWMVPDGFIEAQVALAKGFKFFDFSVPPSTRVELSSGEGESLKGEVADWRNFDWEAWGKTDALKRLAAFGPCILVKIDNADVPLLVATHDLKGQLSRSTSFDFPESVFQGDPQRWERKALRASIESSGKIVVDAKTMIGRRLSAFWPEDEVWYDADPLSPETVSLDILASHVQFTLKGEYCPLAYEDGDFALSPTHYVRKARRRCFC